MNLPLQSQNKPLIFLSLAHLEQNRKQRFVSALIIARLFILYSSTWKSQTARPGKATENVANWLQHFHLTYFSFHGVKPGELLPCYKEGLMSPPAPSSSICLACKQDVTHKPPSKQSFFKSCGVLFCFFLTLSHATHGKRFPASRKSSSL